jgi:sarcosine oxidase, subunit gamma
MAELVDVTVLPAAARLSVRAETPVAVRLGEAFGVALPQEPCRANTNGERAALWLGPDEWLIVAPDGDLTALYQGMPDAPEIQPASVVDVSDRNAAAVVSGPKASEVINAFNPLDLGVKSFPVGMCTRTVFAKAEIVLWRTGPETFRIEVWRSFLPYVLGSLAEAMKEYKA